MSVKFLFGRLWKRFCIFFFALFFTLSFAYAPILQRMEVYPIEGVFYFLVSTDERIEVGAEFVKLDGGAGYFLEDGGRTCVAVSVYLKEEDAIAVSNDTAYQILQKGVDRLYFKGMEKRTAKERVAALELLKNYITILDGCISRLEKGETQESCKRVLKILEKQLLYAGNQFVYYKQFSKLCAQFHDSLLRITEDTIFLSSLRYLLCRQADGYVRLCEEYRL